MVLLLCRIVYMNVIARMLSRIATIIYTYTYFFEEAMFHLDIKVGKMYLLFEFDIFIIMHLWFYNLQFLFKIVIFFLNYKK